MQHALSATEKHIFFYSPSGDFCNVLAQRAVPVLRDIAAARLKHPAQLPGAIEARPRWIDTRHKRGPRAAHQLGQLPLFRGDIGWQRGENELMTMSADWRCT